MKKLSWEQGSKRNFEKRSSNLGLHHVLCCDLYLALLSSHQFSPSHLRQCLSPEPAVVERSSAIKRPAADEDEEEEEEPKKKISFGLSKSLDKGNAGASFPAKKPLGSISIKLGQNQKAASSAGLSAMKPKVGSAAAVFGDEDDEDDQEEMPPEAKMRMKNIGRDTPTSAGPNSFGKTRMGFCDSKKIYERQLREALEEKNNHSDKA